MKKLFGLKAIYALALAAVIAIFIGAASVFAAPWSFGVMGDTQWNCADDGQNPNTVAAGLIQQLNREFINKGVKFVIQVGDLTDKAGSFSTTVTKTVYGVITTYLTTNIQAIDTRAIFAQPLYNAGIGFFPLRGNHEDGTAKIPRTQITVGESTASEFVRIFPQTSGGRQNNTPGRVFNIPNPDSATQPFPAATSRAFSLGSNFSSPAIPGLKGLSYSFDFENARFVLLDQFTRSDGSGNTTTNNNILDQLPWIDAQLAGKPARGYAFVFSHKNLIGESHSDVLFGANPSANVPGQQTFCSSLKTHGVRYAFGGHEHLHQRSFIKSPNVADPAPVVQEIIAASDSSNFHIPYGNRLLPGTMNNDLNFDTPVYGISNGPRETPISQELYKIGYYIVTVDGPLVTVDYYSADNTGSNFDSGAKEYLVTRTPILTFKKKETFGYSLNGKEFLVSQGESYTDIQDSFEGTTARILDGTNGSTAKDGSSRALTKVVATGWTPRKEDIVASDILILWGMSDLGRDQTDVYTLSMTYDHKSLRPLYLDKGTFVIATRDANGKWVNAVNMNAGGTKKFVVGPWKHGYKLGTYGFDPGTHTAWTVINHNGNFAVVRNLQPGRAHRK
jgi:hypothetical protein